ncbi:STAS domain-containing protein [candidate division KSB1 bacterium]|nr:STAS domain-containing protein [candidate division KSB1 bacterium]
MTTCTITERSGITWLAIHGRIDSMTSPEVQHHIDELILGGRRLIVIDMEEVNFVSSAGLRVFIMAHNQLQKVGGEIVLYKISEFVMLVFKISGFDQIFKIVSTEEELSVICSVCVEESEVLTTTKGGIIFKHREMVGSATGVLCVVGSQDKLASSDYTEDDVITISQSELHFGTGLATVGERYDEYKHLFGEALFIKGNIFFYPATRRPAVDFMFYSGENSGTACRFLHGFVFNGTYRYLAAFESEQDFITIDKLTQYIMSLPSNASLLGIVLLAESKGIYGMNLKQVPLSENKPVDGNDIFDSVHFPSWINFPVDPVDDNHIVVGVGMICRDRNSCSAEVLKLFSSESNVHMHGGIFEKGPISKRIDQFSGELDRVITELDITKVQHLLGKSRFSNGMLGIIELEG